jgi:hypothetical protein
MRICLNWILTFENFNVYLIAREEKSCSLPLTNCIQITTTKSTTATKTTAAAKANYFAFDKPFMRR